MRGKLQISEDLALPADFVTQTQAILAKRGKGKTYAAHVQAEELTKAGLPWVAIDGVGVWYGLRAGKSGTKAGGLPVLVLGGEHGDIPLEPDAGDVVAEFVVAQRRPTVIDVAEFSNTKQVSFVAAFVETLYRINREALHVFLEEADMFAPQSPLGGEAFSLGAIDKMVRRGRQRGLGITLISQRPAVIHKNPLTQTEMMTVLGFTAPHDIAAIGEWFKAHGLDKERVAEVLAELPRLEKGQAYISSPDWLKFFGRIRVRAKETFDSSATPEAGAAASRPRSLADIPLADLQGRMKAAVEAKQAADPAALKRRVAELERELAKRPAQVQVREVEKRVEIEVPVLKNGQLQRTEKILERAGGMADKLTGELAELRRLIAPAAAPRPAPPQPRPAARAGLDRRNTLVASGFDPDTTKEMPPRQAPPAAPRPRPVSDAGGPAELQDLGGGERKILAAIAQHAPMGVDREQLTVLTGYKRSSRDTYLQRLGARGLIVREGDAIQATAAGLGALGDDFEQLPTGDALREHWLARLPEGERRILEYLIGQHPHAVPRDVIDVGYQRSSRDTYLQRLGARKLVITEGRGLVRASDNLFG